LPIAFQLLITLQQSWVHAACALTERPKREGSKRLIRLPPADNAVADGSASIAGIIASAEIRANLISLLLPSLFGLSVNAQAACTHDCCRVIRSWKAMGKTYTYSETKLGCCFKITGVYNTPAPASAIPGVSCGSTGNVLEIDWRGKGLKNQIPSALSGFNYLRLLGLDFNNLNGLIPSTLPTPEKLYLASNQLSGTFPAIDLSIVSELTLYDNPNLTGAITPACGSKVYASKTKLDVCGGGAKGARPVKFPSTTTSATCLASSQCINSLRKRTQVFTIKLGTSALDHTCDVDKNKNPMQTCLNTITALFKNNVGEWKKHVATMMAGMNTWWQAFHTSCAKWLSTYSQAGCTTAGNNLIANAQYHDGQLKNVDQATVDYWKTSLFSRT